MHGASRGATPAMGKELPPHLRGSGEAWLADRHFSAFWGIAKPLHADPRRRLVKAFLSPQAPRAGAEPFSAGKNVSLLKNTQKKSCIGVLARVNKVKKVI